MTELQAVLARMLVQQGDHDITCLPQVSTCPVGTEMDDGAAAMLVTPEGKALAALVEAAEDWRGCDVQSVDGSAALELSAVIDAYREATK